MIKTAYKHQAKMAEYGDNNELVLNTSDPGTGKTLGTLMAYQKRIARGSAGRCLVIAPLSILRASWADDIERFTNLTYAIATQPDKNRHSAFNNQQANIVLINHDGVKWLEKNLSYLDGFTDLVIDEFTAFKNRTSARSKSMLKVSLNFEHRTLLSGTPIPNTVLDMWHPMMILDRGTRLGNKYFQFRSQVCTPESIGYQDHVKWVDKPGAPAAVADALADVNVRFKFEDCVDIPPNSINMMLVDMPKKVLDAYAEMEQDSTLRDKNGGLLLSAIHAGARTKKMLQILSGTVYDASGKAVPVHNDRYELVMQLISEREHSLVAFNWKHEREALSKLAEKYKFSYAFIDGSVSTANRAQAVKDFQEGNIKVLFCHPQAAAHGLTLTKAATTIWCTPTYSSEQFQQFNRRIYRIGQTVKTETICIAARATKEVDVYHLLNEKISRSDELLDILVA